MNSTLIYNYPAIEIKNYSIQKYKILARSKQKKLAEIFNKSNLLAQPQFEIDIGELRYHFNPITQPKKVIINSQDACNQNNSVDEIQFIVEAKKFVLPIGYTAHFYDRNGVELGFVPVEIDAAGSIVPGQRMYVTIPLILLDTKGKIRRIVIKEL